MNLDNDALPSNRKFGLFFTAVFAALSIYFYLSKITLGLASSAALCVAILAITFFSPDKLLPLNKAWMKFGFVLGKIINPIVLGFIFFILITPIAFITRLAGRDELRLKMTQRQSHWKERAPAGPDAQSFKNQF